MKVVRVLWQTVDTAQQGIVRRPDLPEGASFSVVEDHGDGTVTVEVNDPQAAERELQELKDAIDALTLALLEAQ